MKAMLAVAALAVAAPAYADDPKINFEKYTLPNGLEVILAPDKTVPMVTVNIWYHVGSGNETRGKSGFAHLFEHMMFQGSKNSIAAKGKDPHFSTLRAIGSNDINGTTNTDRTNYFESVPAHHLETALWLESDRMGHFLEVLSEAEMKNQIDVVRNERRQNYDNVPYRKALFALYAALYPEGHPYRYLTIGRHEDLERASLDDVKKFFKTWYVPSNATLAIVGDFDPATAKKLVEKWFGSFPSSKHPTTVKVPAPETHATTVEVEDSFAKLRQVTYVWHSPATYADGDAELEIVANALGAEGRGRLYKALVYDKQLAQSVSVDQDGSMFSGTFDVTVTLRTGADLAQVKQIVADELNKISREGVTDKEIARVVAGREAQMIRRLESYGARADVLQAYNHYVGDPGKLTWDLDRYRKTTNEKIRSTFTKYIQPIRMVTIITNPMGGAK